MQLSLQREVQEKVTKLEAAKFAEATAAHAASAAAAGGSGKKAKKKVDKPKPPKPVVCGSAATQLELLFARTHQELARGTCLLLAALERQGLMPPSYDAEFLPPARRFAHRFAPFCVLARPPPLTPAHYEHAFEKLHEWPHDKLLASAAGHFKTAKSRLDTPLRADSKEGPPLTAGQRADALALAKVAVANGVLIASLGIRPPPPGSAAHFSYAVHAHFAVVSFPPAAKKE